MTSEEVLKAESIIKEWFWQPDSWHRKSVVRYYESAPIQPDVLQLVIDYLKQQETDRLFILNKELQLGEAWKATDAWFQTSPSDKWAGTESTKIRIYQAFKPKADESDGPYTVENGCKYLVTHEFHWDVAEVPDLPASSSGINYTLQGVTRDKDTGLYSCVIERRETVQQDVAEYGTSETAFESRKEEQHLGVKQESVASTGKRASVSSGTIVRRKVTKNPDCTSDVQNETIKEKPVTGAIVEYRKTLRSTVEIRTDRSQNAQVTKTGLAVGETRRSEKTEGNLWNNTFSKTTKDPVGETGEGCERSALEHRHTNLENLATKPTVEQPAPAINESLQKSVRRTEDDTWDVTTTQIVYTPKDTGTIVSGTQSARSETKVGVNQPTIPASGVGGINESRRVTAQPNDHGSFSTTEERIVYIPLAKTATGGTTSRQETVETGVNQVSVPAGSPAVNKQVDVSVSLNDHGSMSTQKRTIVYQPDSRTAKGGTTSRHERVETGVNQVSVPTASPAINKQVDVSVSLNDHGSMTTQKRTIVYQPDSRTATGGTTLRQETVETGVNQVSVPAESPSVNKQVDVSVSLNDHGSMSTQKRTIVYIPDKKTAKGGTKLRQETIETGVNQVSVPDGSPAVNKQVDVSVSLNDHGSMTTQKRTIVYQPQSRTATGGTTSRQETIETGVNQVSVPDGSPAVNKQIDVSVSLNDHGSMTTQKRTIVYRPQSRTATGGTTSRKETIETGVNQVSVPNGSPSVNRQVDVSVSLNDHGSMTTQKRTIVYRPQSRTATGGTTSRKETIETGVNQVSVPYGSPSINKQVDVSVSLNDHGSMTTQKRTIVYNQVTKQFSWRDESYNYTFCAYRNLPSPIKLYGDNVLCSFSPNDHGSYDGHVLVKNERKSSSSGSALAWSFECDVKAQYVWMDKTGKWWKRIIEGKKKQCYGRVNHVQNELKDSVEIPQIGWRSELKMNGSMQAYGYRYKVTSYGNPTRID